MASKFKWNKCSCLSLLKGCLVLGLVNLASTIFFVVSDTSVFHQNHAIEETINNIMGIIDIFICLLMICGCILEHRWPMIPYILFKILLIGYLSAIIVIAVVNGVIIETLVPLFICILMLVFSIVYWFITFTRYMEIEEQSVNIVDFVEMESSVI